MNLYRVDRAPTLSTPVGMNSILYAGDSFSKALSMFRVHKPGFNEWDQPDLEYGVLLSVWSDRAQSYVVKDHKWLNDLLFVESASDLFGPFNSFQIAKDFALSRSLAPFTILTLSERHSLLPHASAVKPAV